MQIIVNGDTLDFPKGADLAQLLTQLGLGQAKIAVEVNREIVPRSQYNAYTLKDGDALEIVQAIGGG